MDVVLMITVLVFLSNTADGGRYQDCPEGWTKGASKCFKFVDERIERVQALRRCRNEHKASLAVIENEEENNVVAHILDGELNAWIGLRRRYGSFEWDDEYTFQYNYSNWSSRRQKYGECVKIYHNGDWGRSYCFLDSSYVCFKKAECEPGWTGDECDRPCHCYRGYACNGTDDCPYGCEVGWVGDHCDRRIEKPEVFFYCMRDREGYTLNLTLDKKNIHFSNYGALNAEGEISPKCDREKFTYLGLHVEIRNVSGVWESDCPVETVGKGILKWTFRLQKNRGVVSFEDEDLQVHCDLSQADAAYDDTGRVGVEEIRERTLTAAIQTSVSPRIFLADPDTLEPVTNIGLGVPVKLVVKLPEGDGVVNPFFQPRNCQAASPDGNVIVQLTDDSGCSLKKGIGFGIMKSISRVIQSKTFPMFYLPGYTEVVFTCSLVPSSSFRAIRPYCPFRG
ncbi:uncharacterized protein [Haliotis asinina]|uniref:uncharacterized protein n=1 Tax=Haliotis asinina TaxID=109174 RepID=UPI003531C33F